MANAYGAKAPQASLPSIWLRHCRFYTFLHSLHMIHPPELAD
jgi:hypothetical protein